MSSWTVALHKSAQLPSLAALLYAAGEDIIFNSQEALTSVLKPPPTDPSSSKSSQSDFFKIISSTIRQPSGDDAHLLLPLLPRLFRSFISAVPKYPLDLPDGFPPKQLAVDNKVKFAAMLFLARGSQTIFRAIGTNIPTELDLRLLKAKGQLLEILESESLLTSLGEAGITLQAEVDSARDVLSNGMGLVLYARPCRLSSHVMQMHFETTGSESSQSCSGSIMTSSKTPSRKS